MRRHIDTLIYIDLIGFQLNIFIAASLFVAHYNRFVSVFIACQRLIEPNYHFKF